MARFTHKGHHHHVVLDPPVDETPSPPVVPTPPSTTPPEETPPPTETPSPSTAPTFSELGATFNDATRALVGGLWQNAVEEGGQGLGSVGRYTNDLTAVQNGLLAEVNAGQFSGATLGHVQAILSDITTAISAANASVNGGGTFGSVANAEQALRASHLDIINIVKTDPALSNLATQNDANGFAATPAPLADGTTAANAPHANLAEIGAIFNDAASLILGGVNADNKTQITDDINAVITDMEALITDNPLLFGGLTGVHADAIVRQLELELTYVNQAGVSPDAGRASNDNILDIIDIVQGDTNLANMASQGGINGFSPFPDALNPTPKYIDNEAQTNFWANFIAQSNSLGKQAMDLVGSGDTQAIATLIADLRTFEKNVTDFDAAQGGIFEARFDNELLGATSTLGAEVDAMIKGLQTGNAALVAAAADQMHANSADVGGNNIPVTGGTYNPDGLTVAEVLGTAVAAAPVAETPAVTAAAAAPDVQPVAAPTVSVEQTALATADVGGDGVDHAHSGMPELAHHLHHTWG
ncbi:hypothetical protein [Bradyrhizobium sp. AUGA SZCCT0283]|jgi:hypothetical protein|uniref:hypothetical protein n=1 Tax=Bradyrhizobium sp. AUGA SZCCT0283 TaxID=2807671 RepID=UPI001BA4A575|nr:hypothetical protein [Bradyrhizobium sp. AUGA SZCCT0283]MBR1274356.1 hypothetical protein [Bradyrhizobium sp. AUGA SZCCT0283]